jgi:hypothetical protein
MQTADQILNAIQAVRNNGNDDNNEGSEVSAANKQVDAAKKKAVVATAAKKTVVAKKAVVKKKQPAPKKKKQPAAKPITFHARLAGDAVPKWLQPHLRTAPASGRGVDQLEQDLVIGKALLGKAGQARWVDGGAELWGSDWYPCSWDDTLNTDHRPRLGLYRGFAVLDFKPANPLCISLSHVTPGGGGGAGGYLVAEGPFSGLEFVLQK